MNIKSIDLFLQVLFATLFGVTNYSDVFALSGWVPSISILAFVLLQIISLFAHIRLKEKPWKESLLRKIHLIGVGVVLLIMFLGLIKPPEDKYDMSGLGIIVYALIPAGILAVFYIVITFLEWRNIRNLQKKKDFIHLK
jgi:hypothetical protein